MRRRAGLQGIARHAEQKAKFEVKGEEIAEAQMTDMTIQLNTFKENLEEFAKKYKRDIKKNPQFRQHFQKMCASIGVDPLASSKGFWAQLLGVGDYYYELGVQIVEISIAARDRTGGLMAIEELQRQVQRMRGSQSQEVSLDDIECSIRKLKSLGSGFDIINVGRRIIVQSVPCELNTDHSALLMLADGPGWISISIVKRDLLWEEPRVITALEVLIREGMVWVDDQAEESERRYWFISYMETMDT